MNSAFVPNCGPVGTVFSMKLKFESKPSELPLWVQIRYEHMFCSQHVSYQESYTMVRDLGPNHLGLGVC